LAIEPSVVPAVALRPRDILGENVGDGAADGVVHARGRAGCDKDVRLALADRGQRKDCARSEDDAVHEPSHVLSSFFCCDALIEAYSIIRSWSTVAQDSVRLARRGPRWMDRRVLASNTRHRRVRWIVSEGACRSIASVHNGAKTPKKSEAHLADRCFEDHVFVMSGNFTYAVAYPLNSQFIRANH
jgi:hypothetical protein